MDFSDPQGGKGSCDREATTIKSHMRRFLNSGHDIETAEQMKSAMESSGCVPGVRVMLCSSQDIPKPVAVKWEGVSFINNIEYGSDGMRVWRSYAVGPGKVLPRNHFNRPERYSASVLNLLGDATSPKAMFTALTPTQKLAKTQQEQFALGQAEAVDQSDDEETECHDKLFSCPEEGRVKSFRRFSSLQYHLDAG